MRTRLTRIPEGVALILDEALRQQLGLNDDSEVELVVQDGVLAVIPESERDRWFREAVQKIDEQYGDVFRRLADS